MDFQPNFLDMPNKMYPGTWVVLAVVLSAILAGFLYLFLKWRKSRVPWKKLDTLYPHARYFSKGHDADVVLLTKCLVKTIALFPQHTKWKQPDVVRALHDVRIYVMDTDKWVDEFGRTVAGIQAGRNLIVGKSLAAFLHEGAHRCEEVIDKERDMEHATWVADGIRAAEESFTTWLEQAKKQT